MRRRVAGFGAVALMAIAGFPGVAWAQSKVEVKAGIQFDFLAPGARSLALGGAFTAVADDATAAFTNPAGLRHITKKEISFEGRVRRYETPFTDKGHGSGPISGQGV